MFLQVCVCPQGGGLHGRGHVWQGHAWQGACMVGGMGGCVAGEMCGWGACMAGGHAWWGHVWQGDMCGRGGMRGVTNTTGYGQ